MADEKAPAVFGPDCIRVKVSTVRKKIGGDGYRTEDVSDIYEQTVDVAGFDLSGVIVAVNRLAAKGAA